MRNNRLLVLIIVIIGIAVAGYLWKQKGGVFMDTNKDPFANVQVPEGLDEATRKEYEYRITGTKAMYAESPQIWETWIAIGNLKSLLGDYTGAVAAYQKSIELQGNNVLGYRNIAEVYNTHLKDYEKAASYYRLALNNNFLDSDLYIALAQVYDHQLNQDDKAEQVYLEGLQKTQGHPDIFIRLVKFYKDNGNTGKYKEYARKLIEANPGNSAYKEAFKDALE